MREWLIEFNAEILLFQALQQNPMMSMIETLDFFANEG